MVLVQIQVGDSLLRYSYFGDIDICRVFAFGSMTSFSGFYIGKMAGVIPRSAATKNLGWFFAHFQIPLLPPKDRN